MITPEAVEKLPEQDRAGFEPLGKFALKGYDEPQEIWIEKVIK